MLWRILLCCMLGKCIKLAKPRDPRVVIHMFFFFYPPHTDIVRFGVSGWCWVSFLQVGKPFPKISLFCIILQYFFFFFCVILLCLFVCGAGGLFVTSCLWGRNACFSPVLISCAVQSMTRTDTTCQLSLISLPGRSVIPLQLISHFSVCVCVHTVLALCFPHTYDLNLPALTVIDCSPANSSGICVCTDQCVQIRSPTESPMMQCASCVATPAAHDRAFLAPPPSIPVMYQLLPASSLCLLSRTLSLSPSFIHSFLHPLIWSFLPSFIYSFIYSSINFILPSFIPSFMH